jgi:hypothetical protein
MANDPTKLFATRADRYPESDESDIAQGAIRTALASIPVFGGPITEVLSLVLAPAVARRRDEWFKELAEALDHVEANVEGFKVEDLAQNEAFISATIQATRIAVGTHQKEKREYLRNTILHVAEGDAPDEEQQQIFLRYLEDFTATHVKLLDFFAHASQILEEKGVRIEGNMTTYRRAVEQCLYPRWRHEFLRQVIVDLRIRGLSAVQDLDDNFFPNSPAVTGYGRAFLNFVLAPIQSDSAEV